MLIQATVLPRKTSFEEDAVENLASQFWLHQVIKEPTHITDTSSSCIDLTFASQPNFIIESSVQSSLKSNCHHQLIFAKFNLEVIFSPPYVQEAWHYKDANIELIDEQLMNSVGKEPF